jgi:hypothetical protein
MKRSDGANMFPRTNFGPNVMQKRQQQSPQQQQQQKDCVVGVDGKVWDLSNLSSGDVPSKTAHKRSSGSRSPVKERALGKLYPSRGSVCFRAPSIRDINSIFEELDLLETASPTVNPVVEEARHRFQDVDRCPVDGYQQNSQMEQKDAVRPMCSQVISPMDSSSLSKNDRLPPEEEARRRLPDLERRPAEIHQQFSRVASKPDARQVATSVKDIQSGISDLDQKPAAQPKPAYIDIEVSPGVHLPVRGAKETELALRKGQVLSTTCACCESRLYCIMSAEYLYCPLCRVIGPVFFEHNFTQQNAGGVGLGFTPETMQEVMRKIEK